MATEPLKVLDLFSGIGGFSLGLERAGMKTIAFCEIDNYCQRVLHKHWPGVFIHSDIRKLGRQHFENWQWPDVIAGGFPCQDISKAGNRAGIRGERSGLWSEMWRLIRELRPRYALIENVPGLLIPERDGPAPIATVLADLSAIGYDAEWDCLPAAAFGAPHLRDRTFIVAYPDRERPLYGESAGFSAEARMQAFGDPGASSIDRPVRGQTGGLQEISDSEGVGCGPWRPRRFDSGGQGKQEQPFQVFRGIECRPWDAEPDVDRVAYGVPNAVDRIKGLGNAIVPQITEWIGRRVIEDWNRRFWRRKENEESERESALQGIRWR